MSYYHREMPDELKCMLQQQNEGCLLSCPVYEHGNCEEHLQFIEELLQENDKEAIEHYEENYGDILYNYAEMKHNKFK